MKGIKKVKKEKEKHEEDNDRMLDTSLYTESIIEVDRILFYVLFTYIFTKF